jgi:hypothetical protein
LLAVEHNIRGKHLRASVMVVLALFLLFFFHAVIFSFYLYVVLLFKQPQLLSMEAIIISEKRYFLTRRENSALSFLTIHYLCWDLSLVSEPGYYFTGTNKERIE